MWQVAALSPYLDVCGVQRVVVSAPVKEPSVLNVVVGVNDDKLTSDHVICTAAGQSATASKPMRPPAAPERPARLLAATPSAPRGEPRGRQRAPW